MGLFLNITFNSFEKENYENLVKKSHCFKGSCPTLFTELISCFSRKEPYKEKSWRIAKY